MKKLISIIGCLLVFQFMHCVEPIEKSKTTNDSFLTIVLMVKDEARVIKDTLKPFVETAKNVKDQLSFFIFDTGSTDSTMLIAEKYLKENEIDKYDIKQEPFIDFATSRNRALELSEKTFPSATFMLMLDAEWYLNNVEKLIEFCKIHKDDYAPSHLIRIIFNSSLDYYVNRLIRCKSGARFAGEVHEAINNVISEKVPSDCFFTCNPGTYGQEKSRKRWLRDIDKLLKAYEKNPRDPRTMFYLAQTYKCLNDLQNARIWYERRTNTPGWDEENFVARYMLAEVYDEQGNWDKAICEYLKAFSIRPNRAEPLVKIALHYYRTNEMALCFLFSNRATQIPYPENDILFVEKEFYTYTRYDLLGISAWYVGEYDVGKRAVEMALKEHPEYPHLKKNFSIYNAKIASNNRT